MRQIKKLSHYYILNLHINKINISSHEQVTEGTHFKFGRVD